MAMMSEIEMIATLRARGYFVRHTSEAKNVLTWNRMTPFPAAWDFNAEAVTKIREAICPEMLHCSIRESTFPEGEKIHTAQLVFL